jgi:hypothetical protein
VNFSRVSEYSSSATDSRSTPQDALTDLGQNRVAPAQAWYRREPEEVVGRELAQALTFEPNKAFLRELLATQMDLTTLGAGYVRDQHERFQRMQEQIHGGEKPPTERVIDMHREKFGEDYRVETEGQHPDSRLRKLNS